jgi:predicted metal-dependent enzyme (double-stranded beta helix superfamily)
MSEPRMQPIDRLRATLDEMIMGERLVDDPERGAKRLLAELTGAHRSLLVAAMHVLTEQAGEKPMFVPGALPLHGSASSGMTVRLFRWGTEEFVPFHDHGNGLNVVHVVRGALTERVARRNDPSADWNGADVVIDAHRIAEGDRTTHPVPHVHSVTNTEPEAAYTLHVSAPGEDGDVFFFQDGKLRKLNLPK